MQNCHYSMSLQKVVLPPKNNCCKFVTVISTIRQFSKYLKRVNLRSCVKIIFISNISSPPFNLTGFFRILLPTKATDFIFPIWSRLKRKQLKIKTITHRIMHNVLNQKYDFNYLAKKSFYNLTYF